MSLLKKLMVDTKSAWVEYPGLRDFTIEIVNLSRPELVKLRKSCLITKFDKKTRQPVESLDEDKFIRDFSRAVIKDWKGFKVKYLEELVLVDLEGQDMEADIPYSQDEAEELIKNSGDFDTWVNEAVFDLDNFRSAGKEGAVEPA